MNQLEYVPGIGGQSAIQLDGPSAFVGTAEGMRGREWQYELGYRDLVNANRPAREVTVTFWTDPETANDLRHAADADVAAKTPGTLIAQEEWKQRAYILAAEPRAIHYDAIEIELRIALMDGAWWRLESKQLRPENTSIDKQYTTKSGRIVTATGAVEASLAALTIYGYSKQSAMPKNGNSVPISVIEAPNLIPYDIDTIKTYNTTGTWSGNVYTYRGIDATFNDDGTITLNNTATGNYTLYLCPVSNQIAVPQGSYTLTGKIPGTGSDSTWYFQATTTTDSSGTVKARNRDYGSGVTLTVDSSTYGIAVFFHASTGDSFSNAVLKPQLIAGSQIKPFVPYGCISLNVGGTVTPIDLDGNFLASLPDGTQDVLRINSSGDVTIEKRVGVVDLGTLTWGTNGAGYGGQPPIYYRSNPQFTLKTYSFDELPGLKAEMFAQARLGDVQSAGSTQTYVITSQYYNANFAYLYAKMSGNNSAERPTGLCYFPLKTPQEITLDPITMPTVENYDQIFVIAPDLIDITAKYETSPSVFLDYPYDYEYDFLSRSTIAAIEPAVLTPCDIRIIVYGPTDEPAIIVGENQYKVNCSVPAGAYLTIDGREKIITLTMEDGTVQNKFADGVRGDGMNSGEYIFQPIASGAQRVEWDGSFGFDLCWYEDEGEPPWKSY